MPMFESRGIDPRSVQIAGLVTAALVVLGLLVSHAAKPDPEPAPALSSKVAPGAAAVEATEGIPVPTPTQPSAAPTTEAEDPAWQEPESSSDDSRQEWGGHAGKGKGHGRWR